VGWFFILLTLLAWGISLFLFNFASKINKEIHHKKSVLDYTNFFAFGDWTVIGFLFDILFGFTIGIILKFSPWWLAKTLVFIVGAVFFVLGLFACIKIFA